MNSLLWISFASTVFAQSAPEKVEMAEGLNASGKIYVVVVVLLVILSGIILFLFRLERKLNKMEKKNSQ